MEAEKIKYIVHKLDQKLEPLKKSHTQQDIFNALTKWKFLKIIICMSIVESGENLCYYGIEYAINDIGYSFGVNNLVLGLTEIFVALVVGRYVTNMPRKLTIIVAYIVTPAITMLFAFSMVASSPFICTLAIVLIRGFTSNRSIIQPRVTS